VVAVAAVLAVAMVVGYARASAQSGAMDFVPELPTRAARTSPARKRSTRESQQSNANSSSPLTTQLNRLIAIQSEPKHDCATLERAGARLGITKRTAERQTHETRMPTKVFLHCYLLLYTLTRTPANTCSPSNAQCSSNQRRTVS